MPFKINQLRYRSILDCNMPIMNGYDLTRAIRAREQSVQAGSCTVWGFTANAQSEEIQRCLEAGMDDCLFKPISLNTLNDRLARLSPLPLSAPVPASPFNPDSVGNLTGNRPEMIDRLLAQLLQSNQEDRQALAELIIEGDHGLVGEMAHRIKGAAKIISAHAVVKVCDSLEQACELKMAPAHLQERHVAVNTAMLELEQALTMQLVKKGAARRTD